MGEICQLLLQAVGNNGQNDQHGTKEINNEWIARPIVQREINWRVVVEENESESWEKFEALPCNFNHQNQNNFDDYCIKVDITSFFGNMKIDDFFD